jgi:hypothetical protein
VSRRDRLIGVVLGIALGAGVITAFVFAGSDQTIDAPLLSTEGGKEPAGGHGGEPRHPPPVATIRIAGGAPPSSGPPQLRYQRGDRVRLRVVSDESLALELTGYGITRSVTAGEPAEIDFRASKRGSYALIVGASHIAVAQLRIE